MWDRPSETADRRQTLSHDRPCVECGHALHTFLPCSDACGCRPQILTAAIGSLRTAH